MVNKKVGWEKQNNTQNLKDIMKRIMCMFGVLFVFNTHPMLNVLGALATPPTKTTIVQTPQTNPALPPINVTVTNNISNDHNDHSHHDINNNATQAQTNEQQAAQVNNQEVFQETINEIKNSIRDYARQTRAQLSTMFNSYKDWIVDNKYKLMLIGACTGYAAIFGALVRTNIRMQDESLWARWRIENSYEQLMQIPQKQLAHDLVFAIQRRYTSEKQFTDFIQPLTQFMHDIQQEKRLLKNYLAAGKWITRLRLHYILPINEKRINQAKKLLQRVLFIEHVFLSWAAEFKMTQHVPS